MRGAIYGHRKLYEVANILYRDISLSNIIIGSISNTDEGEHTLWALLRFVDIPFVYNIIKIDNKSEQFIQYTFPLIYVRDGPDNGIV